MKVLDLFSGIGGCSLGLERAGMETVAFCEYEDFPRKVLNKHWPDVPVYPDVRELTHEKLQQDGITGIDVICGGFPCQPFSVAGQQRAEADDRHLWPEMLRLVRECRPTWVIGENVTGFIGLGLSDAWLDLEAEGYDVQALVIPACAVNASHRRDRVWILAHANSKRQPRQGRPVHPVRSAQEENREINRTVDALRWPSEPPVRGRNDGLSRGLDRDRLKALGNAVVPQVVEVIGRAIMDVA